MTFLSPAYLLLLSVLPVASWCVLRGLISRRAASRCFTTERSRLRSLRKTGAVSSFLPVLALGALGLALARPAWKKEPIPISFEKRDVLFLLDVSRSMLAQDLAPDRLGAAKRAILDCLASFEGNRVGLVTFAGSPSSVCPLTTDYAFFEKAVREASPENVDHGGTRIGDAIRKSADKLLDPRRAGLQDIIIISDGGDQQSLPEEAAAELEDYGVFLIVIGIGDDRTGARIPARQGIPDQPGEKKSRPAAAFTMHQGQEVWTRLEPAALRAMAREVENGAYLPVGTRSLDLGRSYRELVEHLQERREPATSEDLSRWREEFSWFLGLATALLLLEPFFRLITSAAEVAGPGITTIKHPVRPGREPLLLLAIPILLGASSIGYPSRSHATEAPAHNSHDTAKSLYNHGVALLEKDEFRGAVGNFNTALQKLRGEPEDLVLKTIYNLGCAHFALAESPPPAPSDPETNTKNEEESPPDPLAAYLSAARAFRACLDLDPGHPDAGWNLELALLRARDSRAEQERDARKPEDDSREDEQRRNQAEDQQESDTEEGEDGSETNEDQDGDQPTDHEGSQTAMDLLNQDIPPPAIDPRDLLMEEQRNNESRQKRRGKNYQAVEKDW